MLGGTTIVDASGRIVWVDRPYGATASYFIGKSFWDFCESPKSRTETQAMFSWTLAMGETTHSAGHTGGPIDSACFRYSFERITVPHYAVISRFSPFSAAVLTPAEEVICALMVQDFTCEEITATLNISPNTYQSHRRSILQKTGEKGLAGLTRWWENRERWKQL